VSKALHFKHEVPVTVRFSANSGIPKMCAFFAAVHESAFGTKLTCRNVRCKSGLED
jgi:hypothetical protein